VCATEPERAARQRVAGGFAQNYDYALQVLLTYATMPGASSTRRSRFRFYARWLQEFGQLKSAPNAVIADGADWRFLNELKRIEGGRRAAGWIQSARRLRNLRGVPMQIIQWPGHFWPLAEPCIPLGAVAESERPTIIERTTRGGLHRLCMGR
jgi:hypothetical protein